MFVPFNVFLLVLFLYSEAMVISNNRKVHDVHHNMTEMELEMYFGIFPENQIPDYDVSYLTYVNERGEEISQQWIREATNHSRIYINISLFGLDLHLNLTINHNLLAPHFHIETRHKNGSRTVTGPIHRNFYHGHVVSHPRSVVSLSGEDGLSGAVVISGDKIFMIYPLTEHLSKNYDGVRGRRPHLIVKREALGSLDINDNIQAANVKTPKFLEVAYIADHLAIEHFGLIELPVMLLSIGNIVAKLFYDTTFGEQKVTYLINRIVLANGGQFSYPRNETEKSKYYKMSGWFGETNALDDKEPSHSDQAMLFTSYSSGETFGLIQHVGFPTHTSGHILDLVFTRSSSDVIISALQPTLVLSDNSFVFECESSSVSKTQAGLGMLGVLCKRNDASGIVSLRSGLSTAFMVAHETLHNFGYGHDGEAPNANCSSGTCIMSPVLSAGKAAFTWSNCTRKFAQKFLKSNDSQCLDDSPNTVGPTLSPMLRAMLPGEVFDADKQCELIFGVATKQCPTRKGYCSSLYCTDNGVICKYIVAPPADGTRCGERHWCIKGNCVDDGSLAVNGNWGDWSGYSLCTRTCGGGVQHQIRKCDNPSPKNGGMPCPGSDAGEYTTCNKQPCEPGAMSFRKQQCKQIGYMDDYIMTTQACQMWCKTGWTIFHYGKVTDGSRCSNDPTDNDVCVNNICESVGCDGEYHSEKEKDRCGVCDGDGSTCVLRILNYTENFYKFGNSNPFSIIVLKNGSSNIHAKKKKDTWNDLGVCGTKGEYLINLPSWSTTVYKAGTKIIYRHESNKFKDEISIPGPIIEELELVLVRNYENNQGVDVEYYEPLQDVIEKSPETLFVWKAFEWSACSKECAGGTKKKTVKCFRSDDNSVVGKRFCNATARPIEKEACNIHDCPAEWYVTPWTACSRTCGTGEQTKNIICRRMTLNSWIVENDTECVGQRPDEPSLQRNCNEFNCPPEYVGLPWSKCSTTCGKGAVTRELKCQIINEKGKREDVPKEMCSHHGPPKPPTTQGCNYDAPCAEPLPRYVLDGCYNDKRVRVLPELLENLRSTINWKDTGSTIKECAVNAHEKNKTLFAIQFYGECLSYADNPNVDYTIHGKSTNFWSGLGGAWTNCVYKFS